MGNTPLYREGWEPQKCAAAIKYYQRSKNVPKPTVEKCTRVNFGQTSDEEILSIFQNRGQTAGHYWREGTGFLIDLQPMRDHVESSGRRTPSNRQARFTPAVQGTLSWGHTHPQRLNSRGTVSQETAPAARKMQKQRHFFPALLSKEHPWPILCR